ncbi:MAG: O-antigen ligase family protein [Anaerolineae bacterium]
MNKLWMLDLQTTVPKVLLFLLIVALSTALALLPWKWAGLLLVSGVGFLLILIRSQFALPFLALAVPFGSIREVPLGPMSIGAAELVIAFLCVSWLACMVAARRILVPRAPLLLPLSLFLAAILLSTLVTTSLELSFKEIIKWLEVTLIYCFMADVMDERWGQWVVWALLAAGSAEALVGVYQFLRRAGPEGFILFGRFMRAYGHFAQPNPFAGYLGLTLPLSYALLLETFSWLRRSMKAVLLGGAFILTFVAMLAAMIMSWSRGGWVGFAAALLVITAARSRTARINAIVIGALVAYLLLIGGAQYLPPALVQRLSDFIPYLSGIDVSRVEVTDANWAVVERMAHWLAAIGMFSDHPWLGVGIGNYPVAYPQYALGRWRDALGHAHNYYLNIAAEAGIIGLSAYLFLFGACFAYAWRTLQRLSELNAESVFSKPKGTRQPRKGILRFAQNDTVASQDNLRFAQSDTVASQDNLCCAQSDTVASQDNFGTEAPYGDEQAHMVMTLPRHSYWRAVTLGVLGMLVHLSVHNLFDNLFVHSMNVQLGLCLGLLAVAEKSAEGQHAHWH